MEKEFFKSKWNKVKGSLKNVWGDLTDDEIRKMDGDYDKTVGFLQEKYGLAKADIKEKINSFLKDVKDDNRH